jgi:hypothetical protein
VVLSIKVPHFPDIGSEGVPPVPPTILMSGLAWGGSLTIVATFVSVCSQGQRTYFASTKIIQQFCYILGGEGF